MRQKTLDFIFNYEKHTDKNRVQKQTNLINIKKKR